MMRWKTASRDGSASPARQANRMIMWIVAAIAAGLLLPNLVRHGMFMDGLMYAVISMNLANGEGSFWFPSFSETVYRSFHEHPPLVFGLQSLLFRLSGNGFLTERIYSALCAALTAIFMVKLWNIPLFGKRYKKSAWLPLLLWITIPLVYWSYGSNMLENTMGLFTLLAVLLIAESATCSHRSFVLRMFLAGVCVLAGLLSKGLPALFPLAVPALLIIVYREGSLKKGGLATMIMLTGIVIPALLIRYVWPQSTESISLYLDLQVFSSLRGERVVGNRFSIIWRLFTELLPVLLISVVIIATRFRRNRKGFSALPTTWHGIFCILTGLAASLPLMISPKQLGFYLVPSFPFFALGFAFFIVPAISTFLEKREVGDPLLKILKLSVPVAYISVALITFLCYGGYSREREKITAIHTIAEITGEKRIISIDPSYNRDWSLMGYFKRYHGISLDRSGALREFHLTPHTTAALPPEGYEEVSTGIVGWRLYQNGEIRSSN